MLSGQGETLGPGDQVGGQRADLQPDLVLGEVVEGQVAEPGVLAAADSVLDTSVPAVAEFQVSELATWWCW